MPYCIKDKTGWTYYFTQQEAKRMGFDPESPKFRELIDLMKGETNG